MDEVPAPLPGAVWPEHRVPHPVPDASPSRSRGILLYFRIRYALTADAAWLATYKLWTKVCRADLRDGVGDGHHHCRSSSARNLAPGFMNKVGRTSLGPLLAYEVLTAFFLEATFLGIMLFGMNRVPGLGAHLRFRDGRRRHHALGVLDSRAEFLDADADGTHPSGGADHRGRLVEGALQPLVPWRFTHMLLASGLTASFVVAGLSAWRLLRAPEDPSAHKTLRTGLLLAAVLAPIQALVGDQHGLNTLEHQPAKIAAIEAIWKTEKGVPLCCSRFPNEDSAGTISLSRSPRARSLLLKHDADAELKGIDAFAPDTAPVTPVFFAFRAMVGIGVLMLVAAWVGVWATRRGALPPRWMLWTFAGLTFSGWAATECGWIVTEIGRQPWLVTGILRTSEAVGAASGRAARREPHHLRGGVRGDVPRLHGRADPPLGQGNSGMSLDLPLVFAGLMGLAMLLYVGSMAMISASACSCPRPTRASRS